MFFVSTQHLGTPGLAFRHLVEERGRAPCTLLPPPAHPAPQTKQTSLHPEAGPTWKSFSLLPANQVQRPPSFTWKPSPPGLDYDSESAPPLPRLPSLQLKLGSEALQSSPPLHQARGSPPGPQSALRPRWWWWWWVLPLETTKNKNHPWLQAGSHPDHILFGYSIDSIMPILPNKRTFYADLQKRDVTSAAGNQPSQSSCTGQWAQTARGQASEASKVSVGGKGEQGQSLWSLSPRAEREDSAWDLAFCPALHTLVVAGSQIVE